MVFGSAAPPPSSSSSSSGPRAAITPIRGRGSIASRYLEAISCTPQDVSGLTMSSPQTSKWSTPSPTNRINCGSGSGYDQEEHDYNGNLNSSTKTGISLFTAQTTGASASWTTAETRSRASKGTPQRPQHHQPQPSSQTSQQQPQRPNQQQRQGSFSNNLSRRTRRESDTSKNTSIESLPLHQQQDNSVRIGAEDDCSSIESSSSHRRSKQQKQERQQEHQQQQESLQQYSIENSLRIINQSIESTKAGWSAAMKGPTTPKSSSNSRSNTQDPPQRQRQRRTTTQKPIVAAVSTTRNDASWIQSSLFPRTSPLRPNMLCVAAPTPSSPGSHPLNTSQQQQQQQQQQRQRQPLPKSDQYPSRGRTREREGEYEEDPAKAPTEVMMNLSRNESKSHHHNHHYHSRQDDFLSEAGAPTEVMTNLTTDFITRQAAHPPPPPPPPAPRHQPQSSRVHRRYEWKPPQKNRTDFGGTSNNAKYFPQSYFPAHHHPHPTSTSNKPPVVDMHSLMDNSSNEESSCLSRNSHSTMSHDHSLQPIDNSATVKSLLDVSYNDTEDQSSSAYSVPDIGTARTTSTAEGHILSPINPYHPHASTGPSARSEESDGMIFEGLNTTGTDESSFQNYSLNSMGVETGGKKVEQSTSALKAVFGGRQVGNGPAGLMVQHRIRAGAGRAGGNDVNSTIRGLHPPSHSHKPNPNHNNYDRFPPPPPPPPPGPPPGPTSSDRLDHTPENDQTKDTPNFKGHNDDGNGGQQSGYGPPSTTNSQPASMTEVFQQKPKRSMSDASSGWTPISLTEDYNHHSHNNGSNGNMGHVNTRGKSPIQPLFSLDRLDFSFDSQSPIRKLKAEQHQRSKSLSVKESYEYRASLREQRDRLALPDTRSADPPTRSKSLSAAYSPRPRMRQSPVKVEQPQGQTHTNQDRQGKQHEHQQLQNQHQSPMHVADDMDPIFCPESMSFPSRDEQEHSMSSRDSYRNRQGAGPEPDGVEVQRVLVKTWPAPKNDGNFVENELVEIMEKGNPRRTDGHIPTGESKSSHPRQNIHGGEFSSSATSTNQVLSPPHIKNQRHLLSTTETSSHESQDPDQQKASNATGFPRHGSINRRRPSPQKPHGNVASGQSADGSGYGPSARNARSVKDKIRAFNARKISVERTERLPRKPKPLKHKSWAPSSNSTLSSRQMLVMGAHLACMSKDETDEEKKDDMSVDVKSLRSAFESRTEAEDDDTASVKSLRERFEPPPARSSDSVEGSVSKLRSRFEAHSRSSKQGLENKLQNGSSSLKEVWSKFEFAGSKPPMSISTKMKKDKGRSKHPEYPASFHNQDPKDFIDDDDQSLSTLGDGDYDVGNVIEAPEPDTGGVISHPGRANKGSARHPGSPHDTKTAHEASFGSMNPAFSEPPATHQEGQYHGTQHRLDIQNIDHDGTKPIDENVGISADNNTTGRDESTLVQQLGSADDQDTKMDDQQNRRTVVSHFQSMRDRLHAMTLAKARSGKPLSKVERKAIVEDIPERFSKWSSRRQAKLKPLAAQEDSEINFEPHKAPEESARVDAYDLSPVNKAKSDIVQGNIKADAKSNTRSFDELFGSTNMHIRKEQSKEASSNRSGKLTSHSQPSVSRSDAGQIVSNTASDDEATAEIKEKLKENTRNAIFRKDTRVNHLGKTGSGVNGENRKDAGKLPRKNDHKGHSTETDYSDGVTLDFSIANVSNLTNPTTIASKDGEPETTPTSSAEEAEGKITEASSTQTSEAAAPLIEGSNRMSDDISRSTRSAMAKKDDKWDGEPKHGQRYEEKLMSQNRPTSGDVGWDIQHIDSSFPFRTGSDDNLFSSDPAVDPFPLVEWDAFDNWDELMSDDGAEKVKSEASSKNATSHSSRPTTPTRQLQSPAIDPRTPTQSMIPTTSTHSTPLSQARTVLTSSRRAMTPTSQASSAPYQSRSQPVTPNSHGASDPKMTLKQQNRNSHQLHQPTTKSRPVTPTTPLSHASSRQMVNPSHPITPTRHLLLKNYKPTTPSKVGQAIHQVTPTRKSNNPIGGHQTMFSRAPDNALKQHSPQSRSPYLRTRLHATQPSADTTHAGNATVQTKPGNSSGMGRHQRDADMPFMPSAAQYPASLNPKLPTRLSPASSFDGQSRVHAQEGKYYSTPAPPPPSPPSRRLQPRAVPLQPNGGGMMQPKGTAHPAINIGNHLQSTNISVKSSNLSNLPGGNGASLQETAPTQQQKENEVLPQVLDVNHSVIMQSRHQMLLSRQRAIRQRRAARDAGTNSSVSAKYSKAAPSTSPRLHPVDPPLGNERSPVEPPGVRIVSPPSISDSSVTSLHASALGSKSTATSATIPSTTTSGAFFGRTHPHRPAEPSSKQGSHTLLSSRLNPPEPLFYSTTQQQRRRQKQQPSEVSSMTATSISKWSAYDGQRPAPSAAGSSQHSRKGINMSHPLSASLPHHNSASGHSFYSRVKSKFGLTSPPPNSNVSAVAPSTATSNSNTVKTNTSSSSASSLMARLNAVKQSRMRRVAAKNPSHSTIPRNEYDSGPILRQKQEQQPQMSSSKAPYNSPKLGSSPPLNSQTRKVDNRRADPSMLHNVPTTRYPDDFDDMGSSSSRYLAAMLEVE